MMRITIAWVTSRRGKSKLPGVATLCDEYLKRLSRFAPTEAQDFTSEEALLKFARDRQVKFNVKRLTVGTGDDHVQLRFGPGVIIASAVLDRMITVAREALGNDQADVAVDISEMQFETGRDLEDYLKDQGLDARPEEIEQ